MDKRTAKRSAHHWVALVIEGALSNGAAEIVADNEDDSSRIYAAAREIRDEHYRKATGSRLGSTESWPGSRWE